VLVLIYHGCWYSILEIVTGKNLAGAEDFSLLQSVQTGSRAHPTFCSVGSGGTSPRGKVARA